jgi:hypothetical protein
MSLGGTISPDDAPPYNLSRNTIGKAINGEGGQAGLPTRGDAPANAGVTRILV